ncbi:MAG: hypothetical protein HY718_05200 [Planctomycetes bacterium]|nr:hypothetical protein [Planctomycetota bacterium]
MVTMAALLAGCGYSNQPLYRESVRSVYVEMFHSKEFRRGIEFQLTEAVRKAIDRSTPYRNAPQARADTVLEGEILDWRETAVGTDPITDRAVKNVGTLSIRYRWKDVRTGKLLVDRPLTVTTSDYVRLAGEQSFDAYGLAVDQMARKVVESMETPW